MVGMTQLFFYLKEHIKSLRDFQGSPLFRCSASDIACRYRNGFGATNTLLCPFYPKHPKALLALTNKRVLFKWPRYTSKAAPDEGQD